MEPTANRQSEEVISHPQAEELNVLEREGTASQGPLPPPIPASSAPLAEPTPARQAPPLPAAAASNSFRPVAEADPALQRCVICGSPIRGAYYLSEGAPWCPACKEQSASLKSKLGFGGFLRCVALGLLGALLAGGLWALAVIITGYELGLIAILVGVIVGYGVKLGAKGRGGRGIQFLALGLTFYALAYAMIPVTIHTVRSNPQYSKQFAEAWEQSLARGRQERAQQGTPPVHAGIGAETAAKRDAPSSSTLEARLNPAGAPAKPKTEPEQPESPSKSILHLLRALGVLLLALMLAPLVVYVMALAGSPISIIFVAIALWEAWKLNRPVARNFAGPFQAEEAIDFAHADYSRP